MLFVVNFILRHCRNDLYLKVHFVAASSLRFTVLYIPPLPSTMSPKHASAVTPSISATRQGNKTSAFRWDTICENNVQTIRLPSTLVSWAWYLFIGRYKDVDHEWRSFPHLHRDCIFPDLLTRTAVCHCSQYVVPAEPVWASPEISVLIPVPFVQRVLEDLVVVLPNAPLPRNFLPFCFVGRVLPAYPESHTTSSATLVQLESLSSLAEMMPPSLLCLSPSHVVRGFYNLHTMHRQYL